MGGYKSRLCLFFPNCPQADKCSFAHGEEELKKHSQERVTKRPASGYKTKLCTVYPRCPRGPTCTFAHGEDELKAYTLNLGNTSKSMNGYKVRLCNLHPNCTRPSCSFAHGENELQFYQNQSLFQPGPEKDQHILPAAKGKGNKDGW